MAKQAIRWLFDDHSTKLGGMNALLLFACVGLLVSVALGQSGTPGSDDYLLPENPKVDPATTKGNRVNFNLQ